MYPSPETIRRSLARLGLSLNPVATEAAVKDFEKRARIKLPGDYRDFLVRYGDGGAGPEYGFRSLAQVEKDLGFDRGKKSKPLDPGKPFALPATVEESERIGFPTDGIIPLADGGCGGMTVLISAGPERGNIWAVNNVNLYAPLFRSTRNLPMSAKSDPRQDVDLLFASMTSD